MHIQCWKQDQGYKTKTKTEAVWDRSCHKTTVSDLKTGILCRLLRCVWDGVCRQWLVVSQYWAMVLWRVSCWSQACKLSSLLCLLCFDVSLSWFWSLLITDSNVVIVVFVYQFMWLTVVTVLTDQCYTDGVIREILHDELMMSIHKCLACTISVRSSTCFKVVSYDVGLTFLLAYDSVLHMAAGFLP